MTNHDLNSSLQGVQLKGGQTASEAFHHVLKSAIEAFPVPFSGLDFPDNAAQFRNRYATLIPEFESARLSSAERTEIAHHLAEEIQAEFIFQEGKKIQPLTSYLRGDFSPLPLVTKDPNSKDFWRPKFTYRNQDWTALDELAEELLGRDVITDYAATALKTVHEKITKIGPINLSQRKIVVLGANAEMASTNNFLEAGADLLWLDKVAPSNDVVMSPARSGRLTWSEEADLLSQPGEILATIIAFAGNEPVDLCLYAYAPGQARELKLTVAMNTIINLLPISLVRSVTLLLSPTTATPLQGSDLNIMRRRILESATWETLLTRARLLTKGPQQDNFAVSSTVVNIQGTSYQAAQYLGKLITAESWASSGQIGKEIPEPIRVSANTAAITRTRSMNHPIFAAAFEGAPAFRIETFTADQSSCLNGLLTIYDWLNPEPTTPGLIRVHGGIHTLPYTLESALRIAAAIGVARSPRLLLRLLS